EWASIAENVSREAELALQAGDTITARKAYMRASNYYRTAMFSLPPTDNRLDQYLTSSRELFHQATSLFEPPIEILAIPFGDARLPGYFLSAGQSKRPTLIALNGADSSNEELVHWIGFAAVARGWNCLVFEGPGQWSALQLNPGLFLQHDYEVPVKAVVDYLVQRDDVDTDNITLIGYSLGSLLAARTVAFEKRISACIVDGLVVDVGEAWEAVWPPALQKLTGVFDTAAGALERLSPELRGFINHHMFSFGVSKPSEILNAYRPFKIQELAPQIECQLLLLYGEGEYAQTNAKVVTSILHFVNKLRCSAAIHEFSYQDGWAASHCQIGAFNLAQAVVFDWLDDIVNRKEQFIASDSLHTWDLLNKYHHTNEMIKLEQTIRAIRV
ncbi:MAG TPA: alpha/beta fold hydrolase, partial [Ktedonobacteraceae bacterium]|nr:alpha/beta fold hydrolase [Ktedonobacteraceae bacterium]